MKKLLIVLAMGFAAQTVMAEPSANAGTTSATLTVAVGDCGTVSYLKEAVTVKLSVGVAAGAACDTTAAAVSTGSVKGKGKTYTGSSTGGSLTEEDLGIASINGAALKTKAAAGLGSGS